MKRLNLFSILALMLFVLWGCNERSPISSESDLPARVDQESDGFRDGALLSKEFEYEVVLENLTPATGEGSSQPLAPPVLATHTPFFHIFKVGKFASSELAQVAEDAVSGPLVEKLSKSKQVFDVQQGDGVIFPGATATLKIKTRPGFHKLSLVSMLVNTNDGFAGADGIRLPLNRAEYYLRAYDAGSEKNTEMMAHIPGPCCGNPFVRVPTHKPIKYHKGIRGKADLDPEIYGWHGPVVKLTITRIN